MTATNGDNHRSEIMRLEAQIDELEDTIESCRKFIVAGRIAIAGGGVALIATLASAIPFNPSAVGIAGAAVLGGIVAAGSNHSTAKQAARELTALEVQRATLIEQLDLSIVSDGD
jgi:outer membrane murein-binding lipoprotein Lpp